MKVRELLVCLIGATAITLGAASASAGDKSFVPQGHTYSPDEDRLPLLNSQRDRINSQADIYEAEIYRAQRERAILEGELTRHIQHELFGGAEFQPRY